MDLSDEELLAAVHSIGENVYQNYGSQEIREDDLVLAAFADAFERQFHHQQQIGRSLNTSENTDGSSFLSTLIPIVAVNVWAYESVNTQLIFAKLVDLYLNKICPRHLPTDYIVPYKISSAAKTYLNQDRVYFGLTSNRFKQQLQLSWSTRRRMDKRLAIVSMKC
ncbi:hypothetical protein OS493_022082 [Desmophyllum pertusum]|uniref:Uncharacterized protein n=1 Tax=Desmophyllum pertusum TaxID=174260 RepID=A0A9X0CL88_9CNID|nr:hypothetical protein OS493_022082 [Desmophyllum pertusum]